MALNSKVQSHPSQDVLKAMIAIAMALTALAQPGCSRAEAETIQVYKTPTCGCCTKWIDHLREAGFNVEATDMPDLSSLKAMNGISIELSSCHTAIVEGYVLEGHVPASDVRRLLAERPKIAGLAVPGMPMGSPGMEHSDSSRHEGLRCARVRHQGRAEREGDPGLLLPFAGAELTAFGFHESDRFLGRW